MRYDSKTNAKYGDGYPKFWYGIRGRKVLEVLKPQKGERILEIGCDTGWMTRKIRRYSDHVFGMDINYAGLKIANMRNLVRMDAANIGFRDNSFDKIICLHTIEHVPKLKEALEEMSRVLKPTGTMILIYPFEIIRGICAMISTWAMSASISGIGQIHILPLSKARKLHVNKLYPREINRLVSGNGLCARGSIMFLDPWLSYLTVLEKKEQPQECNSHDVQYSESTDSIWVENRRGESLALPVS